MRFTRGLCLVAALLTIGAAPLLAQAPAPAKAWRVAPYILLPNMNGTTGIGPVDADVDASPSDVFDNLQFGAMLALEYRMPQWAVAFDGLYMDLGKDGESLPTRVDLYQAALELAILRQVAPWLEVLAGGRVNLIGSSLRGPTNTLYETDVSWFDPFIGARLTTHAGERWTFTLHADIGGFGIGSDFAWQLHPEAEFALSPTVSLTGGYRLLGMDYEEGSGLDRFAYDLRTFGVQLGLALHF